MSGQYTTSAYHEFIAWLEARGERPTGRQDAIAELILLAPRMSGKSWLIERLYEYDQRKPGATGLAEAVAETHRVQREETRNNSLAGE